MASLPSFSHEALSTGWNSWQSLSQTDLNSLQGLLEELKARSVSTRALSQQASKASEDLKALSQKPLPAEVPTPSVNGVTPGQKTGEPVASTSATTLDGAILPKPTNGVERASSPDASDSDGLIRKPKKKRKHDALVIGSDEESSDVEIVEAPPINKARKLDRLDTQQSSILETLPLPGHKRPDLERKDSLPKSADVAGSPAPRSPSGTPTGLSLKLKLSQPARKIDVPLRKGPLPPGMADDFSMPYKSLVPHRLVTMPPAPLPKRQEEVSGDFDVPKPNTQTPYSTFLTSVEPYLRSFGDDDLAFLSVKSEDIQPFLIPALGRYYGESWADEDAGLSMSPSRHHAYRSPLEPAPLQRSRPGDINDDTLSTEHVQLGPLSERLVASLGEDGLADFATSMPDETDTSTGRTVPIMDAVDLEERLKRELRFLGVFPTDPLTAPLSASLSSPVVNSGDIDWAARTDDEISTALRACQRALRDQIAVNEARKARLATLVRERMAYQEYEGTRDGLEKVIETGWIKRQRHNKPKKIKPKETTTTTTKTTTGGGSQGASSSQAQQPEPKAALEPKPPMPEDLIMQLDRRRRFINAFAQLFDAAEEGKWRGIPERSVFDDDALSKVDNEMMQVDTAVQ